MEKKKCTGAEVRWVDNGIPESPLQLLGRTDQVPHAGPDLSLEDLNKLLTCPQPYFPHL